MHVLWTVVEVVLALTGLLRGKGFTELALGLVLGCLFGAGFVTSAHEAILTASAYEPEDGACGSLDGHELGGQFRMVESSPN